MTDPFVDPDPSQARGRRNWFAKYLGVQEKYDSLIHTALVDASEDIEKSLRQRLGDQRIGSQTRRYQFGLASRAAKDSLRVLFNGIYSHIHAGQSDAALAAVEAGFVDDSRVLFRLIPNASDRGKYEDSFRQSASRGIDAMLTRIIVSHKPLSKQVYDTRAISTGYVDRIINSSLAKGDSAADLAKAVRSSISPDVAGGVAYAAKRLGRTEINNAFHAQSVGQNQDKPWVDRIQWHLSGSHPPSPAWPNGLISQMEVCERLAKLKNFEKDQVPDKPHPQCLCYTTPKLTDWTEFENNLVAGFYDGYIAENL